MRSAPDPKLHRRRFLQALGLAGLSTPLTTAARALAQAPGGGGPKPSPAPAAAAPPDSARAAAPAGEEISEDAKALAAIIRRRYGQHLSDEQLASITRDFDGDLKAFQRLHSVRLANGDEPDFTFRA
jgi:hypothetical protein